MSMENVVFGVGLIVGSLMGVSVCVNYLRYRILGASGALLGFLSVALIGLSIWNNISFRFGPNGFEGQFNRLVQRVDQAEQSQTVLTEELIKTGEALAVRDAQFTSLVETLQQRQPPAEFDFAALPRADLDRLRTIRRPTVPPLQ